MLAGWISLGNCESGGKRLSNRTRKAPGCCAAPFVRPRGPPFEEELTSPRSLPAKLANTASGKAIVATAHRLSVIAFVLRDSGEYCELGDNYFDRLHPSALGKIVSGRPVRLGLDVGTQPAAPLNPPARCR